MKLMINSDTIYAAYEECDLNNYWTQTPYETYYSIGAKSKGLLANIL